MSEDDEMFRSRKDFTEEAVKMERLSKCGVSSCGELMGIGGTWERTGT